MHWTLVDSCWLQFTCRPMFMLIPDKSWILCKQLQALDSVEVANTSTLGVLFKQIQIHLSLVFVALMTPSEPVSYYRKGPVHVAQSKSHSRQPLKLGFIQQWSPHFPTKPTWAEGITVQILENCLAPRRSAFRWVELVPKTLGSFGCSISILLIHGQRTWPSPQKAG